MAVLRRLRYSVAMSLDGYIAGPDGEYDWIVMDPAIDFAALFAEFDTAVMGRRTFEVALREGGGGAMPGIDVIVFSRTLRPDDYPAVTVTAADPAESVARLKEKPGKDIWLFGGGVLFRTLADARLVDTVEVGIMPVLLGEGIPLLPAGASLKLRLTKSDVLASGIVMVSYAVLEGTSRRQRM